MVAELARAADNAGVLAALPVPGAELVVHNRTRPRARGAAVLRGEVERFAIAVSSRAVALSVAAAHMQLSAVVEHLKLLVVLAVGV